MYEIHVELCESVGCDLFFVAVVAELVAEKIVTHDIGSGSEYESTGKGVVEYCPAAMLHIAVFADIFAAGYDKVTFVVLVEIV